MDTKKYWWECPNCGEKVNAMEQIADCFDEKTGEAEFSVEDGCGIIFHTIFCHKCKARWVMSISGMEI